MAFLALLIVVELYPLFGILLAFGLAAWGVAASAKKVAPPAGLALGMPGRSLPLGVASLIMGVLLLLSALSGWQRTIGIGRDGQAERPATTTPVTTAPGTAKEPSSLDADRGIALCDEMEKAINRLADFTQTTCLPSAGKRDAFTFIIVSSEPVFSVEASKKAWLLVVAGAVGYTLNKDSVVPADELYVSDANSMKTRTAYVVPAAVVKKLQRRIKADEIDLETMYSTLRKQLSRKTIPEKHP